MRRVYKNLCPATISASIMATNMRKNSLKNAESDNNKILYETLLEFFYSETVLTVWISLVYIYIYIWHESLQFHFLSPLNNCHSLQKENQIANAICRAVLYSQAQSMNCLQWRVWDKQYVISLRVICNTSTGYCTCEWVLQYSNDYTSFTTITNHMTSYYDLVQYPRATPRLL